MTIQDIRAANAAAGLFFFQPAALRFFRSRILPTVYSGPGGTYFLTSEQMRYGDGTTAPRCYTVRQAWSDGTVHTAEGCPFNEWSRARATATARRLAAAGPAHLAAR